MQKSNGTSPKKGRRSQLIMGVEDGGGMGGRAGDGGGDGGREAQDLPSSITKDF